MYQEWKDDLEHIERELLNYIYSYWKKSLKWPENIEIKTKFIDEFPDGTDLSTIAEGLGYIFVQYSDYKPFTRLSILGMALCNDSEEDIDIYLKIVRYLSKEIIKDHKKSLTIKDIQKHFNFSDEEMPRICEFFHLAPQLFPVTDDYNFSLNNSSLSDAIIKFKDVKTIDDYYMKLKNGEMPVRFSKSTVEPLNGQIKKVFISYSIKDKYVGAEIKKILKSDKTLKNSGIKCKCFMAHEDIEVSEEWKKRIREELSEADVFIPILSDNFKKSDWCSQEAGIAYFRDILFIPLSLDKNIIPYGFMDHLQGELINRHNISSDSLIEAIINKFSKKDS